jgi:CBS domain-containing protein
LSNEGGRRLTMAQHIAEVMTKNPVALPVTATAREAARAMRDRDIGDVIVLDQNDRICGIVTDRDIVVRGVAQDRDPSSTRLADICSPELTTLSPDETIAEALRLMTEKAIRRLPVVQNGRPVGIVSLGDLAVESDSPSALGEISAAPPNR